jgi:hypothetical protein
MKWDTFEAFGIKLLQQKDLAAFPKTDALANCNRL